MIEKLKKIGASVLSGDHDEIDLKRIKLLGQVIEPIASEDCQRAICINFDIETKTFKFELDEELSDENEEYFFALKVDAPNAKKIFCSTNSFGNLL